MGGGVGEEYIREYTVANVPLKQVMKFFSLASSRKSYNEEKIKVSRYTIYHQMIARILQYTDVQQAMSASYRLYLSLVINVIEIFPCLG